MAKDTYREQPVRCRHCGKSFIVGTFDVGKVSMIEVCSHCFKTNKVIFK